VVHGRRRNGGAGTLTVRYPAPGRVEMISRTLFVDRDTPFFRRFVGRLFAVTEIESLEIHAGGAEIRYAPDRTPLPRLVRRVAAALAQDPGQVVRLAPLHLNPPAGVRLHVRRYDDVLSTWEICHELPGRMRLRHPALRRRRAVADALREELATAKGVLECDVSLSTGSVVVVYDPERLGREELLVLSEIALLRADEPGVREWGLTKFTVGGALLGLAVAGHFAYPPLLVLCATLLVAANVDTFQRAGKALRARAIDVDVLYSILIALTVMSGSFLSIALMAWSVATWPLWLDRRLATTRRALAADRRTFASLVSIRRDGIVLRTPAMALRPGDVTVVEAGGTLPADGVVRKGSGRVDERRLTGSLDVTDKAPGQPVYAGARVVSGRLVIEVTRALDDAVATELRRRLMASARVELGRATEGAALARRAAPPVLALSAVGAVTGGLGAATAVLAPNYSSAPELATPLDRSATLLAAAGAGFLVRDEAALLRLARADVVVIDGADGPEAAALVSGLRERGIDEIVLTSRPDRAYHARLLRRLRRRGSTVAFVGSGDDLAAAREADVAIAVGGLHLPAPDRADVVLVSGRLDQALELLDLARLHARETRLNRHLGLWPNVVAIGGALVLGLASLHSTILCNVGALAVYWRGSGRLDDAEKLWRDRRP
jgi:cation transport ATPase